MEVNQDNLDISYNGPNKLMVNSQPISDHDPDHTKSTKLKEPNGLIKFMNILTN